MNDLRKFEHSLPSTVISGVNILPFDRMRHPGTITWSWGRITADAKRQKTFFEIFFTVYYPKKLF